MYFIDNPKIVIISRKKLTDALISERVLAHFPHTKIIQYQIPYNKWIPWIIKKIKQNPLKKGLSAKK